MCDNVDTAVKLFTERFTRVLDQQAQMKIFQTRKNYAPWLSLDTKSLIIQRNEAQARAALSNTEDDWRAFRKIRNKVNSKLKAEKIIWQRKKLIDSSNNSGDQWKSVLSWLNWKPTHSPTQLQYHGKIINKPAEIANLQNEFFISKVAKLSYRSIV